MGMESLYERIQKDIEKSAYCGKKIIQGSGNIHAGILLLGEAPGGEEEKQGIPFVGSAGKNLNEFLTVLGLSREDIYITNSVKFRPTKESPKTGKPINRTPTEAEVAFFKPYLLEEISFVNPEIIVTLGNTALRAVAGRDITIGSCHGSVLPAGGYQVFPLYHPASIIYNRGLKEVYLADLNKLKNLI